jgi:hypothetical protein
VSKVHKCHDAQTSGVEAAIDSQPITDVITQLVDVVKLQSHVQDMLQQMIPSLESLDAQVQRLVNFVENESTKKDLLDRSQSINRLIGTVRGRTVAL